MINKYSLSLSFALCSVLVISSGCGPAPDPLGYLLQPLVDDTAGMTPIIPDEDARDIVDPDYCNDYSATKNPYFGDTHIHTVYSLDAWIWSNYLTPRQALQYAKGAAVGQPPFLDVGDGASTTRVYQIDRPLDFAMISDHTEHFGELTICADPNLAGYDSSECATYRNSIAATAVLFRWNAQVSQVQNSVNRWGWCGVDGAWCIENSKGVWAREALAADIEYDTSQNCSFTSLIGYEWSASPFSGIQSQNLHRNVVFKNNKIPEAPLSYLDVHYPEDLWDGLTASCTDPGTGVPGCDVLAIPHNSNLSNGRMFEATDKNGDPLSAAYAQKRIDMEPLFEIMQHKGQSECSPGSSPSDELCGFEYVPWNHLGGDFIGGGTPPNSSFVREALKQGTGYQGTLGVNPFEYGFIGSSDSHISTPGYVTESNYTAHRGPDLFVNALPQGLSDTPAYNPGGLAVVWAEQNTRNAIFNGMRNKEAYATSGNRPIVRFFGSRGFTGSLCQSSTLPQANLVSTGYADGVPMGGVLPAGANSPTLVVSAQMDPQGRTLEKVQIIKGWTDSLGNSFEEVVDVTSAAAGDLTVNESTCAANEPASGYSEICAQWTDPDFDAGENAFYYARVVENPSCRWSTYQCNSAGVVCSGSNPSIVGYEACCDGSVPKTIKEMAWTSPIYYKP